MQNRDKRNLPQIKKKSTHLPVLGTNNKHSPLVVWTACQGLGIKAADLLGLIFIDCFRLEVDTTEEST